MFFLSAIIWFAISLHHAVTGATLYVNDTPTLVGTLPAAFVVIQVDTGSDPALTYGFAADGLVGIERFGETTRAAIPFGGYWAGTIADAGDGSTWWLESFVAVPMVPEPCAAAALAAAAACLVLFGRKRAVR